MTTYIVIPTNQIVTKMIDESKNNATSFIRSLDGDMSILTFCCEFPDVMQGYGERNTHEKIKQYLEDNKTLWP